MSRIYNFNAGPSTLPLPVLEEVKEELPDYKGCGLSILEASHRSKEYEEVHMSALSLFRELLGVPDNFEILLMGGGATLQFGTVPLNFLTEGKSCDFTLSGRWAQKAYTDHKKQGEVNIIFDGSEENYTSLPDPTSLKVSGDAAYLHMTSNETVNGVQWHSWPDTGGVPIVSDMSSDIMSRPLPFEKFGLIYAGAQKNLGPAGVTAIIIRKDMLEKCPDSLPVYLNYQTHAGRDSMYNTPPVYAIYILEKVLKWVKDQGGLEVMEELTKKRSDLLYETIEKHGEFYKCPIEKHCRSRMNVVFTLPSEELTKNFISQATDKGLGGLKGHRSVGGCRASIYNAMPLKGVEKLAHFMDDFAQENG